MPKDNNVRCRCSSYDQCFVTFNPVTMQHILPFIPPVLAVRPRTVHQGNLPAFNLQVLDERKVVVENKIPVSLDSHDRGNLS